ncbi:MAG: DNA (cytosine-5-)-methyltransferase [Phocaeicola sp.]
MNEITKQIFGTKSENDCVRVFEAFSGYGSQSLALKRLGLNIVNVGISEIDRYAIQAHKALHGEVTNYGDISKVDWNTVPDFDLFTMSSPCTDFSSAGKQLGGEEGSGTRSSLLWECRRAIIAKKPKYILFENVKAITQSKFIKGFNKWQIELESYGYTNYAKVLNAKDFGVPQNRERLFMISILNDDEGYEFPVPFKSAKRLKDVLDSNVDAKYYLSEKLLNCFLSRNELNRQRGNGFRFEPKAPDSIAGSILTKAGGRDDDNYVFCSSENKLIGHVEEPKKEEKSDIYECSSITLTSSPNNFIGFEAPGAALRGRNPNNTSYRTAGAPTEQRLEINMDGIMNTITTVQKDSLLVHNSRIRKLTPRECFRLMGVSDDDINILLNCGISNSQLYKMAGNSIVVDNLYYIFKKLFIDKSKKQLLLF